MTTTTRLIKIPFKTGTTEQNNAYLGGPGEITIDRTKRCLRVHDGSRRGGEELLRRSDLAEVQELIDAAQGALGGVAQDIQNLNQALPTYLAAAEASIIARNEAVQAASGITAALDTAEGYKNLAGDYRDEALGFRNQAEQFKIAAEAAASAGGTQVRANWAETDSTSMAYVQNKPTLFSGSYADLSNKPTLFSGSYADLSNKPTLFSGAYADLTGKPTIPAAQVPADWNASTGVSRILNKPALFSGSYTDLTNKPALFSGSYTDLTNKPTIPTNNNQLTNGAGYLTTASARAAISVAGTGLTYDAATGVITGTGTGATMDKAAIEAALGYIPWHAGNDGASSGLDADTVGGAVATTNYTANTIVKRDGGGSASFLYVNLNHSQSTRNADTVFFSSTDVSVRRNTLGGMLSSLGLNLVNNTADLDKPVSTATQNALNLKADITYVDSKVAALVDSSPAALDTLSELATALGNDANFATTTATSLGNRLRFDAAQNLTAPQKTQAYSNLGLATVASTGSYADLSNTPDLSTKEGTIAVGATSQYFRGDKSWRDFATDVRAAVLTGLSVATSTAAAATDTLLVAIGKLQAQVTARLPLAGGTMSGQITMAGYAIVNARLRGAAYVATSLTGANFTIDVAGASKYNLTANAAPTFAFSNWPTTGEAYVVVDFISFGSYSVSPPAVTWVNPDNTTTTSLAAHFTALAAAGGRSGFGAFSKAIFWCEAAGTVYGKFI